jgi:hypothetical protein
MTGAAVTGDTGWLRCVWIMTDDAGFHRIVGNGIDLRITGRLGSVVSMTENAVASIPRSRWEHFSHAVDMLLPRTVTGFTSDGAMIGNPLGYIDIFVAVEAGSMPCVPDREGRYRVNRSSSIVSFYAKRFGNEELSCDEKDCCDGNCDDEQTLYLIGHKRLSSRVGKL